MSFGGCPLTDLFTFLVIATATSVPGVADEVARGYSIPIVDISRESQRQTVVDREPGQYLGHPSTLLLEDGQTMLCVYPKGHGRGAIVYRRSADGGRSWGDRQVTPASWTTSLEVPTLFRTVDASGKKRVLLWSGLYPARLSISEDDGQTWSDLTAVGDWGGIVVMSSLVPLAKAGRYAAFFHDDGRFRKAGGAADTPVTFQLLQTVTDDGGLSWSEPSVIYESHKVHLCEPCCIRSPDGLQLAMLTRENRRQKNSHVLFSNDDSQSWSDAYQLPGALTGDRHVAKYLPDGRLFISFRDTTHDSDTQGDWVAWVGTYDDIVEGREGQYRIRLMDNHHAWDCGYAGVEVLQDGTIVATSYGHWTKEQPPYVVSVRLRLDELDQQR